MDKRIGELAEQAGLGVIHNGIVLTKNVNAAEAFENFAQLIVKECSGFRNELGVALCTDPGALHRYFGVEE